MTTRHILPATLPLLVALAGPALAAADNPSFNLLNRADEPVRELFATPAGDATFGRNRLDGKTIPPNEGVKVNLPANGNCIYDLKFIFASGRTEERKAVNTCKTDQITIGAAATGPAPGPAIKPAGSRDPSIRLINNGAAAITEFNASPVGGAKSFDNLMANETLAPQASHVFHLPTGQCRYDLRVTFADKKVRERKNADLCAITDLPVQ